MPAKLTGPWWLYGASARMRQRLRKLTSPTGYTRGWLVIPRRDDRFMTAMSAGKPVALGVLRVFKTDCLNHAVLSIFVTPSWRRVGIGSVMARALQADIRGRDVETKLVVMPPDADAAAFFKKALR